MFFGITTSVGGAHWSPSDDERKNIEQCTSKYLEAQDIKDVPPGWALVLVVGMYSLPRIFHPETKKQVKKIKLFSRVKGWFSRGKKNIDEKTDTSNNQEPAKARMTGMLKEYSIRA